MKTGLKKLPVLQSLRLSMLLSVLLTVLLAGCAMLRAWHEIPTPNGCGDCHHQTISADWQVAYAPPTLNDETGRAPWQQPSSVAPTPSAQEQQTITSQPCFHCHQAPDTRHLGYSGTYRHKTR